MLEADPSVADIDILADFDDERFYRMAWTDHTQIIGHMLVEQNATIQRATASEGRWHFRVLFPERSGLSAAYDYAEEHGFSLDIARVYDVDAVRRVRFELTDSQHEALTEAFERGYYTVPRNINQSELAAELDVSHQAISERLRRATHDLIKNALLVDEDESEDED